VAAKSISHVERIRAKVERTIGADSMLEPGHRVLVAVSAGPDSVVLLHMLLEAAPAMDLELAVAHLNHCLRGSQSDADEDFVRRLAADAGLKFYCRKQNVAGLKKISGLSLEAAGRQARYAFLEEVAEKNGFDRIALGHQADDNAEQLLLHLLRGSGPAGLAGIPPVRGRLIRPLIDLTRSEIMTWAEFHGLEYRRDASNDDLRFTRNRVRHRLLPMLEKEFNPNARAVLHRTARLLRQEQQWLGALDARWAEKVAVARRPGAIDIEAAALNCMPPAQARRVLRHLAGELMGYLRGFTSVHIEALLALCAPDKEGRQLHLPLGIRARRDGPLLRISFRQDEPAKPTAEPWSLAVMPEAGRPLQVDLPGGGRLEIRIMAPGPETFRQVTGHHEACFDMDRLVMPLTVRNFRKGDRIRPFGLDGSQKLKKLFIDRKIPRRQRSGIPLVVSGDRIIWAAGIRRAAHAPVTGNTRRILHLRYREPAACK